jgi:hypothetical protein
MLYDQNKFSLKHMGGEKSAWLITAAGPSKGTGTGAGQTLSLHESMRIIVFDQFIVLAAPKNKTF